MTEGHATAQGTARFASRFSRFQEAAFYRQAQSLTVSSLGLGTYLGGLDEATDRSYTEAVAAAVSGGVNFLDTSLNYRHQRSERSIGAALSALLAGGRVGRDELVVATKAGFLVPDAIPTGLLRPADVAGGMHSMAPAFLSDQLERSRRNLGLDTIDVFYLHNPETQLAHVSREDFHQRMRRAFETLEESAARGKISYYGTATWNGYRQKPGAGEALSLARLVELARQVAGDNHRFRFVQLPFNLAMVEAFAQKPETVNGESRSVLETAAAFGVTVVASATLLQSRLAGGLPEEIAAKLPGAATDAQRAIQFTRSTPGIAVALVGMSKTAHVEENLGVAQFPPLAPEEYLRMFR